MSASQSGKSVVVTGANSGIGLATAVELARAGYQVTGTVRSEAKADSVRSAARDKGVAVETVICDVADAESTEKGFREIAARTDGGPWAVVNNAGFAQSGAVEDVDDEAARYQLEVNVLAPARIARLVLPSMRAKGDGRIVNVSSVAGRVSFPIMGWYSASKHALEALTDALRVEVSDFGVKVTLIEPGTFGTEIWGGSHQTYPEPSDPKYAEAYARAVAATRNTSIMPNPVWVARTIRFALTSPVPLARYLVGVDAYGATISDKLVPTALTDYVKAVSTGLRRLPTPLSFLGR
jgi:NAD(P)-dependent dehydrogenase (short-subunit alcohol dehydrogenase family)